MVAGLSWLGCAAMALGPTLYVGARQYVPLAGTWDGARVSLALPYSWLIRLPAMSALREADRLALIGLVPAALLGGAARWTGCAACCGRPQPPG